MQLTTMTISQWENADRRAGPRAGLRLRLAVVYPQHESRPYRPIYHATSHDIGMSGLSMQVDDNAFYDGEVTVILALPPEHSWAAQKIVTVRARMTYAIRSSKLGAYKIGMTFLEFKADGKELLQAALRRRLLETSEFAPLPPKAAPANTEPSDSQPMSWW